MVHPQHKTEQELRDSIDQLQAEVAMPGPGPGEELEEHLDEADNRGIFV